MTYDQIFNQNFCLILEKSKTNINFQDNLKELINELENVYKIKIHYDIDENTIKQWYEQIYIKNMKENYLKMITF